MRILLFNWRDTKHPKSGGAEIVTLEHAEGWVKAGHTVTWFTSYFRGAKRTETINGVSLIRSAGSLSVYLAAPFYYATHRNEFDIIVDEIHGLPFFTPLYVRKPIVAFIHEVAGEIWDYMYPFPVNYVGKLLEKLYFRAYHNIPFWVDAASTVRDLALFGINPDQCSVIPCPITNPVAPSEKQKESVPTFIFVSRVVKMKGIEEVLKAFSFIVKEYRQTKLWIVGGGDEKYMDSLNSMMVDYGIAMNVEFLGRLSEKEKLERMGKAHLLLHASVKEGWGLVVLEAASQWTPSVVYNVSGLVDVVKSGITGIVLSKNSPHEMAQEAVRLINAPQRYKAMQKEGVRWVKSLTWQSAVSESINLLQRTLSEK